MRILLSNFLPSSVASKSTRFFDIALAAEIAIRYLKICWHHQTIQISAFEFRLQELSRSLSYGETEEVLSLLLCYWRVKPAFQIRVIEGGLI